jgi:hypothetical protein
MQKNFFIFPFIPEAGYRGAVAVYTSVEKEGFPAGDVLSSP